MKPPMVGSWVVEVRAVRPFSIHGDLYFELQVVRTDDPADGGAVVRVPQHALAATPAAGERWEVKFLMGQVTAATRV